MGKETKKIIEEYGINALNYPDDLCHSLLERGVSEREVYTMMLILKCCPTVVTTLSQGEVSAIEANALLRSVVIQTGLSAVAVRKVLGSIFNACGVKTNWGLHLSIADRWINKKVLPQSNDETVVSELVQRLKTTDQNSSVFNDLHNLASVGNVQAAYVLGKYYKAQDDENGTDNGEQYFAKASEMGYGPADGALADYKIRRRHKFMWRIAEHFQHPAALSGKDGREWAPLAQKLLKYREENIGRIQSVLILQIIVMILSILMINVLSGGFWCGIALVLQIIGLGWSLFCRFWKPYHSVRNACYLLMLSWILLTLATL